VHQLGFIIRVPEGILALQSSEQNLLCDYHVFHTRYILFPLTTWLLVKSIPLEVVCYSSFLQQGLKKLFLENILILFAYRNTFLLYLSSQYFHTISLCSVGSYESLFTFSNLT